MDVSEHRTWSRARYPLQGSTKGSSPAPSRPPGPSLKDAQATQPSTTGTTTENSMKRYSIASHSENAPSWPPPPQSAEAAPSPTESSVTKLKLNPLSSSAGPEEGHAEASTYVPEPERTGTTTRSLRRTQGSQRLHEEASESSERAPSSIGAPSPPLGEPEASTPVHGESSEAPVVAAPPPSSWKRGAYPLQQSAADSAALYLSTNHATALPTGSYSSTGAADGASFSQDAPSGMERCPARSTTIHSNGSTTSPILSDAETAVPGHSPIHATFEEVNNPLRRRMYPLQNPASSRVQRSSPSPPSSVEGEAASDRGQDSAPNRTQEPNVAKMKLHRRHIYPLQMPASISNLRASPSPPSSPDREAIPDEKTSPIEHHKRDSPVGSVKTLRRTMYPLQSPASIVDLKNPATPQSKIPNDDAVDPNSGISTTLSGQSQILHSSKALRRHVYPLQSPASMADLNRPLTPQSLETKNDSRRGQSESTDNIESRPIAIERGAARRQGYPLQSPASTANLKRPAIQLPSVTETNFAKTDKQRPVNTPEDQTADGPQSHRRHGYPLQSKASVPALHVSPASPSEDNLDPQGPAQVLSEQSRNEDLARKAVGLWRRQVYPLQSPENGPPFQRAPTPQPPEEESKKETNTGPIHLPKNIRAVKDSSSSEHNSGRTIIVCLDGTGDKFDNDNSNIVHLISALKKDDPRQVSYYQAGIGTYNKGGLNTGFSAALDMAVGSELGLHVRDAYHFLMHSYKEGDRICIFGFSRGAYTARCLAGMVHKVGLLPPRNIQQIPFAYEFYADDTREGWRQSRLFKAAFCIDINVYYLGCFDSVASVGFIPRRLPLSTTPTNKARYFRHAMALDERRAKFKVCRYETRDLDDILEPDSPQNQPPTSQDENSVSPRWAIDKKYGADYHPNVTDEEYEILREQEAPFETDVYEVWFAGCHSDVGGGAVANDERHKLAQIPLRWMIRQCFECDTGIIFKTKKLAEFGLDIHTLWPRYSRLPTPDHGPPPSFLEKYESNLPPKAIRRGKLVPIDRYDAQGERLYHLKSQTDEDWTPEQTEDFYDAMQDLNDQLEKSPRWWILEAWPVEYKVPVAPGKVVKVTGMNLGRYRGVDDYEPNLHWTAAHRERHRSYKINARTAPRTRWKIVA